MMPNVTKSLRAVETLSRVDPEFVELCSVLYGPDVDPREVWEDVFGVSKREPRSVQDKERLQARVGLASNYVGLAAGAAGTSAALTEYGNAKRGGPKPAKAGGIAERAGKLVPKAVKGKITPRRAAGAALGLQVANVAGDAVANRVLGRSAKKDTASKALMPPLGKLVQGQLKVNRAVATAPPMASKTAQGVGAAMANPKAAAKQAVSTPGRAAVAGAAAGAAGVAGTARLANRKNVAPGSQRTVQQGQPMAKRAADIELKGTFSKFDDEKRQTFGFASVVKKDGKAVVDRQGDYVTPEDMEMAAYTYVQKSRVGGDMHRRTADDQPHHVMDMIESMVFTEEKGLSMGLPEEVAKSLDGHWWVGFQVKDEDTWQQVRKGGHTGFSIHGKGRRADHLLED